MNRQQLNRGSRTRSEPPIGVILLVILVFGVFAGDLIGHWLHSARGAWVGYVGGLGLLALWAILIGYVVRQRLQRFPRLQRIDPGERAPETDISRELGQPVPRGRSPAPGSWSRSC